MFDPVYKKTSVLKQHYNLQALLELESSASSDEAVRERIASLPPEVSEVQLLSKLEGNSPTKVFCTTLIYNENVFCTTGYKINYDASLLFYLFFLNKMLFHDFHVTLTYSNKE